VSAAYRLLILAIMILAAMGGAAVIINEVAEMIRRVTNRPPTPLSQKTTVCLVLCGVLVAYGYYAYRLILKLTDASLGLGGLEKLGIVFFILGPLAVAAGMVWLMFGPPRLEFEMDRAAQKWIIATLSGFLVMSIVLILLANPKGDIQDMFIQRVKFISSHALYAFWIGYGILVGLAFVDTVTRANRTVKWLGISAALLIPAIPILENAFNKELIRTVGGAEQNQHDFGWQFGNYQLRGAHAIAEELSADEEPLPNPEYPAEMGYAAVFYGGTDPGRFVPTYMIYGAKVRPDVYLITQNALADNTYMSVMRDLYGDLIWIPCIRDGNYAFQKYVEDVNAGRIPASAEIVIQNGRVSVQGVQGVMLINGILAKMIFDYNKAKHDFYVEESYVIQWMYPYLEPHGLIMKINPEPMPAVAPETVRNDMDFWDWYTRRLVNNPKFIRDVVARKSFSKLRSAIAGVYVVRNLFAEAERAFLEAVALYPLSPEANFRLADLYLRWSRPADAIRIMEDFSRHDPANDRAGQFLNDIRNREKLVARKTELESKLASGVPTEIGSAFELADIYRRLGDDQKFLGITLNILNNSNMPPAVIANIARMYAEARKFDYMEIAVQKYLAQMPSDMNAWLDLAATRIALQKTTEALKAAQQAVRVGGEAAQETLRKDKRFDPLRNIPAFRELLGKG
jgi:tetratricopeptide (TPR) repeat protein